MEALNRSDRQKAFLNFLLFFILTIGIVIAAVLFSVRVPFKQNENLRAQISIMENERLLMERFSNKLNETMGYLEAVNKQGTQSEMINSQIVQNISTMNMMLTDSTIFKGLYQNIITNLYDLQAAKTALRGASSKEADIADLQSKLNQCQSERDRLQQNLFLIQQLQQRK